MAEIGDDKKEPLYYEGAGQEALDKWRAMTDAERAALKKDDDIDAINTTDLEDFKDDDENLEEVSYDFLEFNNINLARAFLGMDGGYSIRKLKKFMKRDKELIALQAEEERKSQDSRKASAASAAAAEDGEAAEGVEGAEAGADAAQGGVEDIMIDQPVYSDESDFDHDWDDMDDETFEKVLAEGNAMDFQTEDDAKAFFEGKLKEFSRMKIRKPKVVKDERLAKDPYYAMMKTEKEISSRYADHFDLDDEDYHAYYDLIEQSIGRYPPGFRHYENFVNYRALVTDSSLFDYHQVSKHTIL
jgi:hypothetical protein